MYPVHDWISRLLNEDPRWVPNPDRPVYMELLSNGSLRDLVGRNCAPFRAGDLLWFSFTVQFWFGKEQWGMELCPVQFIRVGRLCNREDKVGSGLVSGGERITNKLSSYVDAVAVNLEAVKITHGVENLGDGSTTRNMQVAVADDNSGCQCTTWHERSTEEFAVSYSKDCEASDSGEGEIKSGRSM